MKARTHRGRPHEATRRADIAAGQGMATVRDRRDHAQHAARIAHVIVTQLNDHVADPHYNVARDLIAQLSAGSEAGGRYPPWRALPGAYMTSTQGSPAPATFDVPESVFRKLVVSHMPRLATAPVSSLAQGQIVRAALIGECEQRGAASSPLTRWEAKSRRHHGGDVLGMDGDTTVYYASKRQRLERRAALRIVMDSAGGWTPFPHEHPNLARAQQRVREHRRAHPRTDGQKSLTIEEGVMVFGEGVGTCPSAELIAHQVVFYCMRRYESGAPRDVDMLCVCRGSHCAAPYFVGRSKTRGAAAPKYCRVCSVSQEAERAQRSRDMARTPARRTSRLMH